MSNAMPGSGKPNPRASTLTLEQTLRHVAHLVRRAGFGAPPDQLLALAQQGLSAAIDQIVNDGQTADPFTPPELPPLGDKTARIEPLTVWWLNRMITTTRPFQEKMVLFWHGHFATSVYKVRYPQFMYQQNQLFRDNALGKFDDLLGAVYKDPAMLIWLDGDRNLKAAPNENFAREVMELFTIGRGPDSAPNYTQDDVHAGARAFTGWRLDPMTGQVTFVPRLHDDGVKTYLGQTGAWNGDDIVRILSAHPATGPFLATKLWRFFASENPPAAAIRRMAEAYYSSGHVIGDMVRTMFTSPEFYSADARTAHIKSPTDFVVSTFRQLGLQPSAVDLTPIPRLLATLGQELFAPPNVGGWAGGASWINAATMLARFNWASRLTGNAPGSKSAIDGWALVNASGVETTDKLVFYIVNTLGLSSSLSSQTAQALLRYVGRRGSIDSIDSATKAQGLIHLALISPEYQLA